MYKVYKAKTLTMMASVFLFCLLSYLINNIGIYAATMPTIIPIAISAHTN